jgi:hypothetical protein
MKTTTDSASFDENRTALRPSSDRKQAVTVLTERELEMVAGAGGKKGRDPGISPLKTPTRAR